DEDVVVLRTPLSDERLRVFRSKKFGRADGARAGWNDGKSWKVLHLYRQIGGRFTGDQGTQPSRAGDIQLAAQLRPAQVRFYKQYTMSLLSKCESTVRSSR